MVNENSTPCPFFTIGVTTYNRNDLLRQTLHSILNQTLADFEVIVGNDYPDEALSCELLGIADHRIRFVNHPRNLQEVGNMNALLSLASGRYFTWLADDDLYEPDFLQIAYTHLKDTEYPPAFFSSFKSFRGTGLPSPVANLRGDMHVYTGREFLNSYFNGRLKIIGVYGLFDTDSLRSVVGSVEELCESSVGLYGEYIFLVRCAMFDRIVYADAQLIHYREHAGSWSGQNIELDKYMLAGHELVRRSGGVLRSPDLVEDLCSNLMAVCKLHLATFALKSAAAEIAQEKYGFGAAHRSLRRFLKEASIIRNSFMEEGGVGGFHATLTFALILMRGFYVIVGMLVVNWLRKSLSCRQQRV